MIKASPHMSARVVLRREVSDGLWILRLRPEAPLTFQAGQYVAVGLSSGSRLIERPYSIASAPGQADLEFFLERVEGGALSPQLYEVREAKGRLLLDQRSGRRKHFMVATVTGVAPFVSMVRSLMAEAGRGEPMPRVALLHGASSPEEFGYLEELSEYARRFEWFDYIPTISRPWQASGWRGERGRVEDVARKHLDALGFGPEETVAYLCGHPGMIANMRGVLSRAGLAEGFIREELYWRSGK